MRLRVQSLGFRVSALPQGHSQTTGRISKSRSPNLGPIILLRNTSKEPPLGDLFLLVLPWSWLRQECSKFWASTLGWFQGFRV